LQANTGTGSPWHCFNRACARFWSGSEWVVIGLFHVPPRHIQSVGVRSVEAVVLR
jgi:hypothetical protein